MSVCPQDVAEAAFYTSGERGSESPSSGWSMEGGSKLAAEGGTSGFRLEIEYDVLRSTDHRSSSIHPAWGQY